jgi:ferredoxin
MRKSRGRTRLNNTRMRGQRGDHTQRPGKRFANRIITKGKRLPSLSHPSPRSPSPDFTGTTRSQEREIQALKRQVQAFKARLGSLEGRTGTFALGSTTSGTIVTVDPDRCVGCGICQGVCPAGAISVKEIAMVDSGRCTGCRLCLDECPMGALCVISLRKQ